MGRATMLTIIPRAIAEGLSSRERINDYNNLPQLNKEVLDVIKEYIANQIGFESVPIAGLCQRKDPSGKLMIKKDFAEYITAYAVINYEDITASKSDAEREAKDE